MSNERKTSAAGSATGGSSEPAWRDRLRDGFSEGFPLPLWLQGGLEFLQSAFLAAALVIVPLVAVWFAGGFAERGLESVFQLAGQVWLAIHGVPLQLTVPAGPDSPRTLSGTFALLPLGLALVPFLLSWRAGRRIARASYTDQLWQGLAGALVTYACFGLATAFIATTEEVRIPYAAAALVPLVVAGAGVVSGARREAGSWARLIGVDATDWLANASQHSRWAGSYVWAAVRAGLVAYAAALSLAAVLLAVDLGLHWVEVSNVYQELRAGPVGGAVLTLGQLGLLPNLAVWTLAWASGGGFSVGAGSTLSVFETTVGPLPAVPVLAALPTGPLTGAWAFMFLPVAAGLVAGWWFLREGENHLDDWMSLKIRRRWLSLAVSTLLLGLAVGAVAGLVSVAAGWVASGSAGIGRFTEIGPNLWLTALLVAAEVAVGTAVGYLCAPAVERDPVLEG